MARTFTYGDAINAITRFIPRNVEDGAQSTICNLATDVIWRAYDWRESLDDLPPFWLIPDVQDYGLPFYHIPDDFIGLRQVEKVYISGSPPWVQELRVIKDLRKTNVRYTPHAIGYDPASNTLRIFTTNPSNVGAPQWLIQGTYKNRPSLVTPSNIATTLLPFDDQYFDVWLDALKWASFSLSGDQREMSQFNLMGYKVDEMAENEGLELGDPVIAPAEPLALTSNSFYSPGRFGVGL